MAGMALPAGSIVALTTPMNDEGGVDIPALREVLRWHVQEGTSGVVILGTTGGEVAAMIRETTGAWKVPSGVDVHNRQQDVPGRDRPHQRQNIPKRRAMLHAQGRWTQTCVWLRNDA